MPQTILIVDDDPAQRRLMQAVVERQGFATQTAEDGQQALDALDTPDGGKIALVLLDLVMPGMNGIEVLEKLRPNHPGLPVIVLTAKAGLETVVEVMRAGAVDFAVKPVSPERLQVSIQNALKVNALTGEITRLKKKAEGRFAFDDLIAGSAAMRQVIKLGERAAQSNIPILIEGESGVGKEVIARAIQGSSDRAGKPFIAVNCGAIPENLVESILFGHEKGAFTGATDKHVGKFVEADGGTLFLDEIGELPLDIQVKLLRVLQENEVDPIGAKRPTKVHIRLISATNRNLAEMVQEGTFREDLFYRLNVFPISLPPLRERADDIPALVDYFIGRFAAEENKSITGISRRALDLVCAYHWPGNVRQLENAVFRAVVLCDGETLEVDDFSQIAALVPGFEDDTAAVSHETVTMITETAARVSAAALEGVSNRMEPPAMTASSPVEIYADNGNIRPLHDIEADVIKLALEHYRGHMSEVARKLGIGRSTLYRKVRDLGLDEPDAATS